MVKDELKHSNRDTVNMFYQYTFVSEKTTL